MTRKTLQLGGMSFILGAILVNIPYTLLIMNFEYPDILIQSPAEILTVFQAGGEYGTRSSLILTWLGFAWMGFPLFAGTAILGQALQAKTKAAWWVQLTTFMGFMGLITQMIGLLRWVLVVPHLAELYTDPQASEAAQAAVLVVFEAVHSYGGNILGEHLGQAFTVIWMAMASYSIFQTRLFPTWVAVTGFLAAGIYALAQTEIFSLVMDMPIVPEAGLLGSVSWLLWLIVVGIFMFRLQPETVSQTVNA